MAPKIVYDRKNCDGYFVCTAQDPDNFEQATGEDKADLAGGTETRSDLWEKEIDADALDEAMEAASGCPVDVIKVLDDDGTVLEGPAKLPIEEEEAEAEEAEAR